MDDYNSKFTGPEIDAAIDRAKAGGAIDTLLAGKAPAGYGLGGNGTEVSDWNNATANGFYRDGKGTEAKHSPFVGIWTCGYVTNYSSGALVQVAFGFPFVNGRYARCEKHRGYHNGGWGEWEWVNPPMELGVEYRTTERYLGKPVYVKAISFGTLPNNGVASVNDDFRGTNIVSVCGITSDGSYFPYYSRHTDSLGRIDIYANIYGGIWVTTTTDKSGLTATIIVKYTKN